MIEDKKNRDKRGKLWIMFYIWQMNVIFVVNIVMKVTKCNGQDVAKISDTPGKGMCKKEIHV